MQRSRSTGEPALAARFLIFLAELIRFFLALGIGWTRCATICS